MTPQILQNRIHYDPLTGVLTWKCIPEITQRDVGWNKRYAGQPALSSLRKNGYLSGTIDGETIYAHRAAWAIHYGCWPNGEIDHDNGKRSDNRLKNLLDKPHAENCMNKAPSNNRTYLPGVRYRSDNGSKPFMARVQLKKKEYSLGGFSTEEEAHEAYLKKLEELGFTPRHGQI